MDLAEYIIAECQRQRATNYGDFAKAWDYAKESATLQCELSSFVQGLAGFVEPEVNSYRQHKFSFDNMRTSHVGFMHGGSAAPAGEVRERFDRWCNNLFYEMKDYKEKTIQDYIDQDEFLADMWIKSLLQIHPWQDANGRTASILRNWFLGTLDNPSPLPYYYGNT